MEAAGNILRQTFVRRLGRTAEEPAQIFAVTDDVEWSHLANPIEIRIRPLTAEDAADLKRMLYLALFVTPGEPPLPEDIVELPEIARYVRDWGQPNDLGFAAVDHKGEMIGAAWLRLLTGRGRGYGHVDDQTPELSMALQEERRGKGIGTRLLERVFDAASEKYATVSLSVSVENPAVRLYRRFGFVTVSESSGSITMLKQLAASAE